MLKYRGGFLRPNFPLFDKKKLIQTLRARTDAPILDCKKALDECGASDIEKCIEWLKKKGVASADKKVSREATQGLVSAAIARDSATGVALGAAMFQLCSETDFASRNDIFLKLAADLTESATSLVREKQWEPLHSGENFQSAFQGKISEAIAKIGENITVRSVLPLPCNADGKSGLPNVIGSYAHGCANPSIAPQSGSIVALCFLNTPGCLSLLDRHQGVSNDIAQTCVANFFDTDTPVEKQDVFGSSEELTVRELVAREKAELARIVVMSANGDETRDFTFPGFPKN